MSKKSKNYPSQNNHIVQYAEFSGPVPPPQILERYEQLVPGIAKQIFETVDRQSAHRQAIEKKIIHHNIIRSYIGQATGFIIAMSALVFGFILIIKGQSAEGIASILTALAGVVGVNIYGKYKQSKELKDRQDQTLPIAKNN